MKKIIALLMAVGFLLISVLAFGQSAGRIWSGKTPPTTKPTSFTSSDIWRDTISGISYGYKTSWYVRSDQMEGATGATGPQGLPGKDGVCPSCPPSSGTSSIGYIRYVTTATELNAAWDGVITGSVRSINIANDITITKPLVVPASYNRILELEGHGGKIIVPPGMTAISRSYASLTEAGAGIDCQLRIRNVIFEAQSSTSIAIDCQATYGTKIEGCRFYSFGTAIKTGWMMGTVIYQCYFWENNISIDLDYARFTGGSNSESQSNHSTVTECKFRHSAGQFCAIKATAVSGLDVHHNIFEGDAIGAQYEVYFDDGNSNVVKEVNITGNHIEQAPSVAGIYVKLKDGYANIDGIFTQYSHTLIKFESEAYAKLKISNVPYLPTGTKFQYVGGGARFWFDRMPSTFDPAAPGSWINGAAPVNIRNDWYDPNGQQPSITLSGRKL